MISTLALALVGTWSYADFLAEPTLQPPPSASPATPPSRPPASPAGPIGPPVATTPTTPSVSSQFLEDRPAASPPTPPSGSTLYRLADASGQAWDHADPSFLSRFVEARNRSFAVPTYVQPRQARSSRCVNGRCN